MQDLKLPTVLDGSYGNASANMPRDILSMGPTNYDCVRLIYGKHGVPHYLVGNGSILNINHYFDFVRHAGLILLG